MRNDPAERGAGSSFTVLQRRSLLMIAMVSLGIAVVAIAMKPSSQTSPDALSFSERTELAAKSIVSSPADPAGYLTMAELALDRGGDSRQLELWRKSAATARSLAPGTDLPDRAIVRGGFLHWYALDDEDRKMVLVAAGRLLDDPQQYASLWQPVLQTTRDPAFLAEHAPEDLVIRRQIRDLAATWGAGGTYRRLQRELAGSLEESLGSMDDRQVIDLLGRIEVTTAYQNEAATLLREIERRSDELPSDLETRSVDLAKRWRLLLPELAGRVAPAGEDEALGEMRALESPANVQIPGSALWRLGEAVPETIAIEAEPVEGTASGALLEVWIDGELRQARVVDEAMVLHVTVGHRAEVLELRVANPRTRNGEWRRLRAIVESS